MVFPFENVIRHGANLIAFDRELCSKAHLEAIAKHSYERCEIAAVSALIEPGDRVLEGGSGIGVVSSKIAEIVGAENLVCCEANPRLAALTRQTLALNGYHSTIYVGVLQDLHEESKQTVSFAVAADYLASSAVSLQQSAYTVETPAVNLAVLLEQHRIDTLVLDIEGSECELLQPAALEPVQKIIFELHPAIVGIDSSRSVLERLHSAGLFLRPDLVNENVFVMHRCEAYEGLPLTGSLQFNEFLELRLRASTAPDTPDAGERLRCVSELARRWPANHNFVREMAHLLLCEREWDASLATLANVAVEERDAFHLHLQAQGHFGLGQLELAEDCWRNAAKLVPDQSLIKTMLARCAVRRGRTEEALDFIQDAVALCPFVASYWDLFARVAEMLGRPLLAAAARSAKVTYAR